MYKSVLYLLILQIYLFKYYYKRILSIYVDKVIRSTLCVCPRPYIFSTLRSLVRGKFGTDSNFVVLINVFKLMHISDRQSNVYMIYSLYFSAPSSSTVITFYNCHRGIQDAIFYYDQRRDIRNVNPCLSRTDTGVASGTPSTIAIYVSGFVSTQSTCSIISILCRYCHTFDDHGKAYPDLRLAARVVIVQILSAQRKLGTTDIVPMSQTSRNRHVHTSDETLGDNPFLPLFDLPWPCHDRSAAVDSPLCPSYGILFDCAVGWILV